MEEIQKIALNKALKTLNALGCSYCIIDADGQKHGTLEVNEAKKKTRRGNGLPRGTVRNYLRPLLDTMAPGEVRCISGEKFGLKKTVSYVSSSAVALFGPGNCTVHSVPSKNEVQILRVN